VKKYRNAFFLFKMLFYWISKVLNDLQNKWYIFQERKFLNETNNWLENETDIRKNKSVASGECVF
jgi:hypothetical protein